MSRPEAEFAKGIMQLIVTHSLIFVTKTQRFNAHPYWLAVVCGSRTPRIYIDCTQVIPDTTETRLNKSFCVETTLCFPITA
jgi:hypothetical protein